MDYKFAIIMGVAVPLSLIILSYISDYFRTRQSGGEQRHEIQPEPEIDWKGRETRQILFEAYKELKNNRVPALDALTACLSKPEVPENVAIYALEQTKYRIIGRYSTKPIDDAIDKIRQL